MRCQRENGVKLIEGRHKNKAAREFMHYLANATREKIAEIIASKNFFALLSDGSQARKTGNEKELVLTRSERGGRPAYFVGALQKMNEFSGGDAESLKMALDSVFAVSALNIQAGNIPLPDYDTKLVTATADGADVNFWKVKWSSHANEGGTTMVGNDTSLGVSH